MEREIVTYLGQDRGVGEEAISRKERVAELRNRTQTPNAEVSVGQTLAKLELLVEGTKQGTTTREEDLRHSGGPSLHLLQANWAAERRRSYEARRLRRAVQALPSHGVDFEAS